MTDTFIPKHGGYQRLLSYQKAEIVYDATLYFCNHFIDRRSRTHDQMIQAARSGKQNIVEGSMASATSKETEIKLTNVARASSRRAAGRLPRFPAGAWPRGMAPGAPLRGPSPGAEQDSGRHLCDLPKRY